jgi:hypothetical protein
MADYLFDEALGTIPGDHALQDAKMALIPLRGHPGPIGWAATILLEGGESTAEYDDAVSILLHTASGDRASEAEPDEVGSSSIAPVISILPRLPDNQLSLPGLTD